MDHQFIKCGNDYKKNSYKIPVKFIFKYFRQHIETL